MATSGDTGKAALEGFRDVDHTKIMVFYPKDGVSEIQKLQMVTQEGSNVSVYAVLGNFDDAQTGVKRIFSDEAIRAQLLERGYFLSSATRSTGAACCRRWSTMCLFVATLSGMESSKKGRRSISVFPQAILVIFCQHTMPSAWRAHRRLICASNRNDVLTEFPAHRCV